MDKDLKQLALANTYFRQVIQTTERVQAVVMCINPGEDIGEETHNENDQILCLVEGQGEKVLNGETSAYNSGDIALVPAGTEHNFITKSDKPMKIVTFYSPPHHPEGTIHKTKKDAELAG